MGLGKIPRAERPNSWVNSVRFGERFAREVRWVRALRHKLLSFQRDGGRRVRGTLRFKQSRFKATVRAARQRCSQLGAYRRVCAGARKFLLPRAPRHRSWAWRAKWDVAARPDGRSNPLDGNGEHISYTALGLDDARRARVAFKLAPQAK